MPNRMIRDSARTSPTLAALSAEGERMFWRLTLVADDHGCFDADPRVLLALCFPLFVDKFTVASVRRWRDELVTQGTIILYTAAGRHYGYFPCWEKYQRVYGLKRKFPEPPAICENVPQSPGKSGSYPISESEIREAKAKTRSEGGGEGRVKGGERNPGAEAVRGNGKAQGMDPERKKLLAAQAELDRRKAALRH